MRILVLLLFLLCVNAHAIFVSLSVNDSRLQTRNWVYKPSGMIGFSVEAGFFNEPENMIDYKLSVGIKRFGYSFDDGNDVFFHVHPSSGTQVPQYVDILVSLTQ